MLSLGEYSSVLATSPFSGTHCALRDTECRREPQSLPSRTLGSKMSNSNRGARRKTLISSRCVEFPSCVELMDHVVYIHFGPWMWEARCLYPQMLGLGNGEAGSLEPPMEAKDCRGPAKSLCHTGQTGPHWSPRLLPAQGSRTLASGWQISCQHEVSSLAHR